MKTLHEKNIDKKLIHYKPFRYKNFTTFLSKITPKLIKQSVQKTKAPLDMLINICAK